MIEVVPELLRVSPKTMAAMDELEQRGFSICYHFGYENAEDILAGMNRAFDLGILDDWLRRRMGV